MWEYIEIILICMGIIAVSCFVLWGWIIAFDHDTRNDWYIGAERRQVNQPIDHEDRRHG